MSNKMLIDATHPEETRVVVLRGNRVEEFDFEAADRQQLRGNIYLAKVTRVEPSLQAAFVEYGGNRHGFLAFSEIHPDYYQIPFADRQALLQAQAEEDEEQAAQDAAEDSAEEAAAEEPSAGPASEDGAPADPAADEGGESGDSIDDAQADRAGGVEDVARHDRDDAEHVESVGAEDALEEVPERRQPRPRQYKIQEVIKRRQVLLVQVVKEERGNKGAALTTYLSLAGRYSVLMPNTGRGGGISRKITNPADRKRLKAIASELEVPEGMGVILRTAGANRTRAEVKRDFEYLLRLWENVRELTLRSTAPKLVYEEGSLIKRSIRDLYSKEIDQIVVAGDDAYREAKDFMRMLMPSHARNVQQYRDETPVFSRNGVEAQLDAMFSPQVTLRSGGYIVINQTEALVSIDVNSGRSTREHSIEDTALNTNLEASEEIARQLRLRDLAGLIVIDFIDMEEKRNNRAVERKMKDCLRADRARIQVGRISHFGLLEMSRQRIRTGVLESSTVHCPTCRGTGQVRSISSLSLQILRAIEDQLLRHNGHHLFVHTRPEVALYILNQKRLHLAQLEARFGLTITVTGDTPDNGAGFMIERGAPVAEPLERVAPVVMMSEPEESAPAEDDDEPEAEAPEEVEEERVAEPSGGDREPRRRRRRRRGNGDDRHEARHAEGVEEVATESDEDSAVEDLGGGEPARAETVEDDAGQEARRRRRGRRGGRRRGRGRENGDTAGEFTSAGEQPNGEQRESFSSDQDFSPADAGEQEADRVAAVPNPADEASFGEPEPVRHSWSGSVEAEPATPAESPSPASASLDAGSESPEIAAPVVSGTPTWEPEAPIFGMARQASQPEAQPLAPEPAPAAPDPAPAAPESIEEDRPKRSGWWNRRSFF